MLRKGALRHLVVPHPIATHQKILTILEERRREEFAQEHTREIGGLGADLRRGSIQRSIVGNSPDAVVDDQEPGFWTSSLPSPTLICTSSLFVAQMNSREQYSTY